MGKIEEEIKCPKCGEVFQVDHTIYASIVKQIRDKEFAKDIASKESIFNDKLEEQKEISAKEQRLAVNEATQELKIKIEKANTEIEKLKDELKNQKEISSKEQRLAVNEATQELERKIEKANAVVEKLNDELKKQKEISLKEQRLAVNEATQELERKIEKANAEVEKLKGQIKTQNAENALELSKATKELEKERDSYKGKLEIQEQDSKIKEAEIKEAHRKELAQKDEQIAYYKDFKARLSTKMVGESLEIHCENEFNKIRTSAFPNAQFRKDTDIRTGSKGDYIYREFDESGNEIISIMFDMKNEQDLTATKKRNEDFFKELDKDRNEKKCEYAVLVSLLEMDNELYETGIVDVSYKYQKMYVVRPQCFITIITLLRNAAMKSQEIKRELALIRNQNIDITNFEDNINKFKEDFSRNYNLASKHFSTAIEEIDKTIAHLQKVRDSLTSSEKQLRLANDKAEDLTIKRLVKDNPTMAKKFEELKSN